MPVSDGLELSGVADMQDRIVRRALLAGANTVRNSTREVEKEIEAVIRSAVGGKLWRAVASEAYPRRGPAREPTGTVYVNGGTRTQGAFQFFTRPGRIKNEDDFFLAIPLPAAGVTGRNRMLTPGDWERRTGRRLRFVFRRGRASLLVADSATTNARTGAARPITRARTAADTRRGFTRGEQTVPIFVLIPSVPFANTANTGRVVEAAPAIMANNYAAELRALADQ